MAKPGHAFVKELAKFYKQTSKLEQVWQDSQREMANDYGAEGCPFDENFEEIPGMVFDWLEAQAKTYNVPWDQVRKWI